MVSFFLKAFTVFIIIFCIYILITAKDIPSKDKDEIFLLFVAGVIPLLICNIFVEIEDENRTL